MRPEEGSRPNNTHHVVPQYERSNPITATWNNLKGPVSNKVLCYGLLGVLLGLGTLAIGVALCIMGKFISKFHKKWFELFSFFRYSSLTKQIHDLFLAHGRDMSCSKL